jgi:hypothetical protein
MATQTVNHPVRPDRKSLVAAAAEPVCARCHHNLDDDGFCRSCGATTFAGRVVSS